MKFETIIYEKKDRIATLTLNRPHTGNALSKQLRDELQVVLRELTRGEARGEQIARLALRGVVQDDRELER